jgi:hypothetical protein
MMHSGSSKPPVDIVRHTEVNLDSAVMHVRPGSWLEKISSVRLVCIMPVNAPWISVRVMLVASS